MDYKGYSVEQLLSLCDEKNVKMTCKKVLYWVSEVYSAGEAYRQYANFPKSFPLNIYSDHGVDECNVYPHEIENDAPYMLVFSDEKRKIYETKSTKKVFNIIPPLILYRRMHNIEKNANAKGTLAFPAHSIPSIRAHYNKIKYIEQLKNLPKSMWPVCVSLHMHDINNGDYKIYHKEGIPVFCAGHTNDYRYAERFYSYLKYFKYTTSNLEGSYLYYAVEMGIPFFFLGDTVLLENISNNDYKKGFNQYYNSDIHKLFNNVSDIIPSEQIEHVNKRISNNNSITGKELKLLLYKALFIRFKKRILHSIHKRIKLLKHKQSI